MIHHSTLEGHPVHRPDDGHDGDGTDVCIHVSLQITGINRSEHHPNPASETVDLPADEVSEQHGLDLRLDGGLAWLGGELRPNSMPVVGAKVLARHLTTSCLLDSWAVLSGNLSATVKPVPDVLLLDADLCRKRGLATNDRDCVFECFHKSYRTTFVLRVQTFVVRLKQRLL